MQNRMKKLNFNDIETSDCTCKNITFVKVGSEMEGYGFLDGTLYGVY